MLYLQHGEENVEDKSDNVSEDKLDSQNNPMPLVQAWNTCALHVVIVKYLKDGEGLRVACLWLYQMKY